MLKDIKAVIFDMDGTLIDSMWIWPTVDKLFFEKEGLPMPETLQKDIEGLSMHATAEYFINNFSIRYEVEELISVWNEMAMFEYLHEVPFKPGAKTFLENLKKNNIKMGIATSNSRELVEAADASLHFSDYIECIVTSKEVPKGKPEPDIYLEVAKHLQVSPAQCLVFEDVPQGILAGVRANMKTCAIQDDFSKDMEKEKRELADYFINSYDEIVFE